MKASTVILFLGTLGAGLAIGDKLNPFAGNRGIANTVTAGEQVASVATSDNAFRQQPAQNNGIDPDAVHQEQEDRVQKATLLIDDLAASDMEKNLARALGGDSIGQQVARGLIAGRHQEIPGAIEIHTQFFAQLRSDPKAGLDVVREAMRRIPENGFEADRITLLQAAASLSGMESDARELALQELTSNVVAVPSPDAQANPPAEDGADQSAATNAAVIRASLAATAHAIFIDLTQDAEQAFAGTLQGILSQPDSAIRRTLIDKFLGSFSDRREALQEELAFRQIDPYSAPGVPAAGVIAQAQTEESADAYAEPLPPEAGVAPGDALAVDPTLPSAEAL